MFQLHTLGSFSARDASGSTRTLPRHRFALLALVAAAGDRGISRDRLLACLWPEVPDEKARARLQQMLHALRASVDRQLFLDGDPLRLNAAVIASDVSEFLQALDAGDLDHAVSLYRGPFLNGFHLGGAHEFDEWLERERDGLRARWASAVERLANDASLRGDSSAAVAWWHALAIADPLNSRVAHRLMEALAASGDRTGALQLAATHTAHVRRELDLEPDANVTALASRIRHDVTSAPVIAPAARLVHAISTAGQVVPSAADASPVIAGHPSTPASPSWWRVHRLRWAIVVAGTSLAAVAAAVWVTGPRSATAAVDRRVAVVPFDNRTGDVRLDALGDLIADMVAEGLVRAGVTDVVPLSQSLKSLGDADDRRGGPARALAEEIGASLIVHGAFDRSGDSLIVSAAIVDGASGHLVQPLLPVMGPADGLLALATTVRSRAVGAVAARLERPSPGDWTYADYGVRQPSYEVYREFAAGLRLFAESEFAQSIPFLERAVTMDSLFAPARLLAARANMYANHPARADTLLDGLGGADVPDEFRYQGEWLRALLRGDTQGALRASRRIAGRLPVAGWEFSRAYTSLGANRPRETVALFDSVWSLRGTQRRWAPMLGNYLAALEEMGEGHRQLEIARWSRRNMPGRPQPIMWEASALVALDSIGQAEALISEIRTTPRPAYGKAFAIRTIAERLLARGHTAAARRSFQQGFEVLAAEPGEPTRKALILRALFLRRLGRGDSAAFVLERVDKDSTRLLDVHAYVGILAAERGDSITAKRVRVELESDTRPYINGANFFFAAKISVALGDRERAVMLLTRGLERGYPFAFYPRSDVIPVVFASRRDPDFVRLRGYAPFEDLLRPRS